MRIAVCDDIRAQAEELARLVAKYYTDDADILIYTSSKALMNAIGNKSKQFDLFFLDILMPEYNGMTVAEHIRRNNDEVPIIFVTSTPDYAIQGYRVDATAYITKPISAKDLKHELDKLEKRRAKTADERIVINADGAVVSIPFSEIRSIEKHDRKTVITRIGKTPVYTNQPISEIVPQFKQYSQFAIFSQSNYVNLTNALEFYKKERCIEMCDGSSIEVARDRMKALLDRFFIKYNGDV